MDTVNPESAPPTPPDSDTLKKIGNEKFGTGHFQEAIKYYTKSLEHTPTAPVYGNRAFCQLKLENFGAAILDADKALALDPSYAKAYYRKGSAYAAMNKWKLAKKCFQAVRKLEPKSKKNVKKLKFCMQEIKRRAFAKALETAAPKPPSERMDFDQKIPASYEGPRMTANKVTSEFVVAMMEHFKKQKRLHLTQIGVILKQMITLLKATPSLIRIKQGVGESKNKFTVCGDTHGQFYDLMNIFKLNGLPSPSNPYLFNGDYVDRGSWSVETCITLFAWKLVYPNALHLTRGNHETKNMNKMYGFEGEVVAKCGKDMMPLFEETFCWLPLAACLEDSVFICHGGLFSNDGVTLAQIEKIKRNRQPPESGLMCDILWSDPCPYPGRHPSKRGCGLSFGPDVTKEFLKTNALKLVVRSHEVKEEGFLVEHGGLLITVFSAPNYCDQMGNKGAMLIFEDNMEKPKFVQYEAVPHPDVKPMAYAPRMGSMFNF